MVSSKVSNVFCKVKEMTYTTLHVSDGSLRWSCNESQQVVFSSDYFNETFQTIVWYLHVYDLYTVQWCGIYLYIRVGPHPTHVIIDIFRGFCVGQGHLRCPICGSYTTYKVCSCL